MAASTGAAPLWRGRWKWGQNSRQAASSVRSSPVIPWGSRELRRTRKGRGSGCSRRTRCGQAGGRDQIPAVLAQVNAGEDHFLVTGLAESLQGRGNFRRRPTAPGPPHLGHDAVAAMVAAALLDLEPGPGVARGRRGPARAERGRYRHKPRPQQIPFGVAA